MKEVTGSSAVPKLVRASGDTFDIVQDLRDTAYGFGIPPNRYWRPGSRRTVPTAEHNSSLDSMRPVSPSLGHLGRGCSSELMDQLVGCFNYDQPRYEAELCNATYLHCGFAAIEIRDCSPPSRQNIRVGLARAQT